MPHVVTVGGGFGGTHAAHALRNAPVRVTVIDRTNHSVFHPLLYQVATAALSSDEIAAPIRSLLQRQQNAEAVMDEVTGLDVERRVVQIGTNKLAYDYLVLATGSEYTYFGHDNWAPYAPSLKTISDARRIRSTIIQSFEQAGLKAKPEVGIQFGAGGASAVAELEAEGTRAPAWAIALAQRFLDAGAAMITIESEGITENVQTWRTDVVPQIVDALGLEQVMFEAADPAVFAWYIKNYGPEVNLFVDHSQIVQLECLRSGIWGTKSLWGRVVTYKG